MRSRGTFVGLMLLACASVALAQGGYRKIEQRLTPEQMQATGLDRLGADQLALLNKLLGDEHAAQTEALREEIAAKAEKTRSGGGEREPVLSKIVGEFRGWSPGTQFELGNGQVWRVVDTPEYYVRKANATVAPAVIVSPGLVGGWYLQVEGHSPRAKVRRVK